MGKEIQTSRITINYAKAVDSGKDNHYLILADNTPIGEVSGDLTEILDINVCGADEDSGALLTNEAIAKIGWDTREVRGRYEAFKERLSNVSHTNFATANERKKEIERIKGDYLKSCNRWNINFGFEKMMCIREWLTITSKAKKLGLPTKFQGETLERTMRYRLQNL